MQPVAQTIAAQEQWATARLNRWDNVVQRCVVCDQTKTISHFKQVNGKRPPCCMACRGVYYMAQKERRKADRLVSVSADGKRCTGCGQHRPAADFWKLATASDGLSARCCECMAEANRARKRKYKRTPAKTHAAWIWMKYRIREPEYQRLLVQQGYGCAICLVPNSEGNRLAVDHDHESGAVRGLLCRACNQGIGHFKDDPGALRHAAAYLERYGRRG